MLYTSMCIYSNVLHAYDIFHSAVMLCRPVSIRAMIHKMTGKSSLENGEAPSLQSALFPLQQQPATPRTQQPEAGLPTALTRRQQALTCRPPHPLRSPSH